MTGEGNIGPTAMGLLQGIADSMLDASAEQIVTTAAHVAAQMLVVVIANAGEDLGVEGRRQLLSSINERLARFDEFRLENSPANRDLWA
jgi:hypothetical protein